MTMHLYFKKLFNGPANLHYLCQDVVDYLLPCYLYSCSWVQYLYKLYFLWKSLITYSLWTPLHLPFPSILFILSRNTNCANLCFSIWSWQVLLWQLTWITLSFHPCCLVTGGSKLDGLLNYLIIFWSPRGYSGQLFFWCLTVLSWLL